jgi:hypothetical protein
MPAVQQGRDFVKKEGVEVAHMGEALAGQDYSEQWASALSWIMTIIHQRCQSRCTADDFFNVGGQLNCRATCRCSAGPGVECYPG